MAMRIQFDQSKISSSCIRSGRLDNIASCILNRTIVVHAVTAPEGPIDDRGGSFSRSTRKCTAPVSARGDSGAAACDRSEEGAASLFVS